MENAGLELNMLKIQILAKGVSTVDAYAAAKGFLPNDAHLLTPLKDVMTQASFTAQGYVGLGVPLGTDAFIQKFVGDTCRKVIDDVDKLDPIDDGFVH